MADTFDAAISELVASTHFSGAVNTEHDRWALYQAAMELPHAFGLLRAVLPGEPDKVMATSTILGMLERTPVADHAEWLRAAPSTQREYCNQRSEEIGLLRLARDGELRDPEAGPGVDRWSNWLQLRLAEQANQLSILVLLRENGRTKRIRRLSSERLKQMPSS